MYFCVYLLYICVCLYVYLSARLHQHVPGLIQNLIIIWVIAERSEANNRDLWAQQSQLASIYIYFHMGDVCHAWGAPGQQHVFKMASLVVTWMPSSNLWRPKTQTFGQIYHILLPGKAYYSSQVSRVYVHSV